MRSRRSSGACSGSRTRSLRCWQPGRTQGRTRRRSRRSAPFPYSSSIEDPTEEQPDCPPAGVTRGVHLSTDPSGNAPVYVLSRPPPRTYLAQMDTDVPGGVRESLDRASACAHRPDAVTCSLLLNAPALVLSASQSGGSGDQDPRHFSPARGLDRNHSLRAGQMVRRCRWGGVHPPAFCVRSPARVWSRHGGPPVRHPDAGHHAPSHRRSRPLAADARPAEAGVWGGHRRAARERRDRGDPVPDDRAAHRHDVARGVGQPTGRTSGQARLGKRGAGRV